MWLSPPRVAAHRSAGVRPAAFAADTAPENHPGQAGRLRYGRRRRLRYVPLTPAN